MNLRRTSRPVCATLLLPLFAAESRAVPGSLEFFVNETGSANHDFGEQLLIPPGFGECEFTLEIWVRPNDRLPVGPVKGGTDQMQNWAATDNEPYSSCCWWFDGNLLLDGHNNRDWSEGTFDLHFYGGGRVRWLFWDGSSPNRGEIWSVGAYPASSTAFLLDRQWHHLKLVRRWSRTSSSQLELWIDGVLIDTETTPVRTNMHQWWSGWSGFRTAETGWFWGVEKQVAVGALDQYEDFRGLVDELRFWSTAKTAGEMSQGFAAAVTGNEPGLVAYVSFGEDQGDSVCDTVDLDPARCIVLRNRYPGAWSSDNAPLAGAGDTEPPSVPTNLQGQAASTSRVDLSWNASTDNVGVMGYEVRRSGLPVGTTAGTVFSDTSLAPATAFAYTVSARDAAGNVSALSAEITVTTLAGPDQQPPTTPANVQAIAVSESRIDLSWAASSDNVGVTGYEVRRDGVLVHTVAATSLSDTGLGANRTYPYSVTATDAAGNGSPPSAPVAAMTLSGPDVEPPTAPTGLQITAVTFSSVSLRWNAAFDNVGISYYQIQRDGTVVTSTSATTFSDSGLATETAYVYSVVARGTLPAMYRRRRRALALPRGRQLRPPGNPAAAVSRHLARWPCCSPPAARPCGAAVDHGRHAPARCRRLTRRPPAPSTGAEFAVPGIARQAQVAGATRGRVTCATTAAVPQDIAPDPAAP